MVLYFYISLRTAISVLALCFKLLGHYYRKSGCTVLYLHLVFHTMDFCSSKVFDVTLFLRFSGNSNSQYYFVAKVQEKMSICYFDYNFFAQIQLLPILKVVSTSTRSRRYCDLICLNPWSFLGGYCNRIVSYYDITHHLFTENTFFENVSQRYLKY